ncbi:hypothetical protein JI435_301940 [Parastagonospora nodorum SN15]|uniref:Uncharacterized protein n=1 Tax=Phaeosphaeria nodorum (strain SN15 / ATCC MYA-4574 / FGSC 10173) TaxID=321614 RepID=A0A7U2F208_PHANO|nr:hypothetical protein JI435_301940 [Parastagonospora nodorum SN15]
MLRRGIDGLGGTPIQNERHLVRQCPFTTYSRTEKFRISSSTFAGADQTDSANKSPWAQS